MKICTVHGVLDCDDELSRKILAPRKAHVKKIFVEEWYCYKCKQHTPTPWLTLLLVLGKSHVTVAIR